MFPRVGLNGFVTCDDFVTHASRFVAPYSLPLSSKSTEDLSDMDSAEFHAAVLYPLEARFMSAYGFEAP